MANIFNTLNIGYTGLNASQVGINTTGHNITNAEVEGYTRQRVITTAATPLQLSAGQVGNGVEIQDIKRIFDNFVFDRYSSVSADKEFNDFETQTLQELSTYFPEIDGVGIKAELSEYYNMWQTLSDNPQTESIKIALAQQTGTLSEHIAQTIDQTARLQLQVNEQIAVNIEQVNVLSEQLAILNKDISISESDSGYSANDLRDKRNVLERDLSRLIGADVTNEGISASINIDSRSNSTYGGYTLSINGFNIVDGNNFHPIHVSNKDNTAGYYEISYERQDGVLIPLEETISGGKIGAMLTLRGGTIDTTSGVPKDGILQEVISQLNAFSSGFIEATNNIYANGADTVMDSNETDLYPSDPISGSNLNVRNGSFDLIVYDINGNETARREIKIDDFTIMVGTGISNSIQYQIEASKDDNGDGNANNNIDDYITFDYKLQASGKRKLELVIDPAAESNGYTFAIADNLINDDFASGSNFAGALGLGRFLDGDSGTNMGLTARFQNDPTSISAGYSSNTGDNRLSFDMVQQQFETYTFNVGSDSYDATVYGMYDITATFVGISTNSAISRSETIAAQYSSTELEYFSVSKVSIDEELTNLIKYQTAYGAAAKIITTVDQMMQTLLGIKQ